MTRLSYHPDIHRLRGLETPRDRYAAALDLARVVLHRILLGDSDPKRLAEVTLGDIGTLTEEEER
jgi:hypothetical protein